MSDAPVPGMTRASELTKPDPDNADREVHVPADVGHSRPFRMVSGMTLQDAAKALQLPFEPSELEWRAQSTKMQNGSPVARILAYVTNRAIMYRLDQLFTPFGWANRITELADQNFLCEIGIRLDSGEWIWKSDGAARTSVSKKDWVEKPGGSGNMQVNVPDVDTNLKGGISAAMKRAAVQWGIGRYLYYLPPGYAVFHQNGRYGSKIGGQWYNWDPPELPAWAVPKDSKDRPEITY